MQTTFYIYDAVRTLQEFIPPPAVGVAELQICLAQFFFGVGGGGGVFGVESWATAHG